MTGKAKEDFEKWYNSNSGKMNYFTLDDEPYEERGFNSMADSMQYGVYVDWFDSCGIRINVHPHYSEEWDYDIKEAIYNGLLNTEYDLSPTRHEARTKAIEKACEIYNKTQTK